MVDQTTKSKRKLPHRGSGGNMGAFASQFLEDRFRGFVKDMDICLTPRPSEERPGPTHAYFPALMACCGTLEYLACMYLGRRKCNDSQVAQYASAFMQQPEYNPEGIRILFEGFRHKIAHHGIASGVWHDKETGRRITWTVAASAEGPALQVFDDRRCLLSDPPWPCDVTHRVQIHLGRLWRDIRDSALGPSGYREALNSRAALLAPFIRCMEYMYPRNRAS